MNAKEQIIRLLKREIAYFKASDLDTTELYKIIAATEAAIFDVPSEEERTKQCMKFTDTAKNVQNAIIYTVGFGDGINFILNYKKTEHDGK